MMGEDTYAMALEPSTNRDAGRWDASERGELLWLEPGEIRRYDLEIGALDGAAAIDAFAARVAAIDLGVAPGPRPGERPGGRPVSLRETALAEAIRRPLPLALPPALAVLRGRLADPPVPRPAGPSR